MDDDHHPYWTHNTMPVSFLFLFFIIHKIDDEEKNRGNNEWKWSYE